MLKRFFKPKWQHRDMPVRQQALAELDVTNDAEIIHKVANEDPSNELRLQALAKIVDQTVLYAMLSQAPDAKAWCVIAERLNDLHLLEQKNTQTDNQLIESFSNAKQQWDKAETFKAIGGCRNIQFANDLLMASNDPQALMQVACSAKSIELRLTAVSKIDDFEILQQLGKKASHKKVLQAVRQRLNQAKAEQQLVVETQASAERLLAAANKLAKQTWLDTQFENKLNSLVSQWNHLALEKLPNESATLVGEFEQAQQACRQIIDANLQQLKEAAQKQEVLDSQQNLCQQMEELVAQMSDGSVESLDSFYSIQQALTFLENSWKQLVSEVKPAPEVNGKFYGLQQKLSSLFLPWQKLAELEKEFVDFFATAPDEDYQTLARWLQEWRELMKKLEWPKQQAHPKQLKEWEQRVDILRQKYQKMFSAQKKKAAYLNQKLATLQKHLNQRNLIAANKLSNYIHLQLEELVDEFREDMIKRLTVIQPRLDELRDWHEFATTPKKLKLCEDMEALINESIAALEKAKKVRELQGKWQALIASDANADQESWERFKKASDIAYQPCLAFYAEQDKIKAGHLEQRMLICESLDKIISETDWENADWKAIDKFFTQVNRDWKKHQPVPENERQSVQKHFNQSSALIRERLHAYKQANLEERQRLVEKANQLLDLESIEKSVNSAIRLQKEWKELGLTFFKADREQWQLFREALDKVFAKRDQLKQSHRQELADNQQKLVLITQEILQSCELDDVQLKQSFEQFEALKQEGSNQLELPRKTANKVLAEFNKACERYQNHYAGLETRLQNHAFNSAVELMQQLQQAEEKVLQSEAIDAELLQQSIDNNGCQDSLKKLFQKRLENLLAITSAEENVAGLQQLQDRLLKMEIRLGIDSPEIYKQQRMALQLEQLQKGLGKAAQFDNHQAVIKMFNFWVTVGLISEKNRHELEERRVKLFSAVGL